MPRFTVHLDVDGETHQEIVSAPDAKLAITKALKQHPTRVNAVIPTDEQLEMGPEDTPGAMTTDEITDGLGEIADAIVDEALAAVDEGQDGLGHDDDLAPVSDEGEALTPGWEGLEAPLSPEPALEELDEDGAVADAVRAAIDAAAGFTPDEPAAA